MKNKDKNACSVSTKGDCAEKKCCPVRFLLSAAGVFVVIFAFEAIFHRVLMMPYYKATASLWRPEADMSKFMYVCLIRQIGTALIFTCLFSCFFKNTNCTGCPIQKGAKLGLKIGLLIGLSQFGAYAWMPFPDMQIPLMWLAGNAVLGTLVGMVLGAFCKMKKGSDGASGKA